MAKGEDKSYQIFSLYDSIELTLDEKKLKSQIELIKSLMKLYGVNSPTRKQLKRNIASLSSIYSALNRVDVSVLQQDLDVIKASLQKEFDEFKLLTGITTVRREGKPKKKVLTSLEDLALLNSKEEISDGTELVGEKTSYNLLQAYANKMKQTLSENPDFILINIPLLINAVTPDFIKLPRLGIQIQRSSFGTTWNNQWVFALRKTVHLEKEKIEELTKEVTKENMVLMSDHAMVDKAFPDYVFFWIFPVRILKELTSFKVIGYALPFPNEKAKDSVAVDVKALREARLKREQEKKCHKETQDL